MNKFAVLLYPNFSLQEITCLTSTLALWFGEKIDYIASENKEYLSEEGMRILPTKTIDEVKIEGYDCIILPGTINPLPALFDDKLIQFLSQGINTKVTFAAISAAPILLAKAGILENKKFTAGFFMQMVDTFNFINKDNFIHKAVIEDDNVITAIGMFYKEFAEVVLKKFNYEIGDHFMDNDPKDYSEEQLTFYWSNQDYEEFLEELSPYLKQGS